MALNERADSQSDTYPDRVFRHWTEQWPRVPSASAGTSLAIVFTASQLGPAAVHDSRSLQLALVLASANLPFALVAAALPLGGGEKAQASSAVASDLRGCDAAHFVLWTDAVPVGLDRHRCACLFDGCDGWACLGAPRVADTGGCPDGFPTRLVRLIVVR